MIFEMTLMFIEVVIGGISLVLFKVYFNSLYICFEQAKAVRNKQGDYKLNFLPQVIHDNIWYN